MSYYENLPIEKVRLFPKFNIPKCLRVRSEAISIPESRLLYRFVSRKDWGIRTFVITNEGAGCVRSCSKEK
jgi:hypothetical protein